MNKCYVESLEKVQQILKDIGEEDFINFYKKVDVFIGDSEAIKFIENILKK
jgi:hypothetical protein